MLLDWEYESRFRSRWLHTVHWGRFLQTGSMVKRGGGGGEVEDTDQPQKYPAPWRLSIFRLHKTFTNRSLYFSHHVSQSPTFLTNIDWLWLTSESSLLRKSFHHYIWKIFDLSLKVSWDKKCQYKSPNVEIDGRMRTTWPPQSPTVP